MLTFAVWKFCCRVCTWAITESPKDSLRFLINTALCKTEMFPEFNPGMHTSKNPTYAVLESMNLKVFLSQLILTKNGVVLLHLFVVNLTEV